MKLTPLPQAPKPAMVHEQKDYFTLPQLIDYANAVAETKLAALEAENDALKLILNACTEGTELTYSEVPETFAALNKVIRLTSENNAKMKVHIAEQEGIIRGLWRELDTLKGVK